MRGEGERGEGERGEHGAGPPNGGGDARQRQQRPRGGGPGHGQGGDEQRGRDRRGRGRGEEEGERVLHQPDPTLPEETDPETLRIIYTNARSLLSKTDHLCILINDANPDLILVTETWLNDEVSNSIINVPGYYIEPELRVDRTDTQNGIGGGLIVYVRNNLIISPLKEENSFNMFTECTA